MSAWPDAPDDFARRTGDPAMFAERRQYRAYLRDDSRRGGGKRLDHAHRRPGGRRAAGLIAAGRWSWRAARSAPTPWSSPSATSRPAASSALDGAGERLIANPWGEAARRAIAEVAESDDPVLIVGTGLTMVDVVLSLDAAGHRGRIVALSRRGQIPRGHAPCDAAPVGIEEVPASSTAELLAWLRRRGAEVGWRAAVDSLRPHSQALWQSLGTAEQRRFLRHARPWWDVHRHRIAPQVARLLVDLIAAGRLEIVAGRIESCAPSEDGRRGGLPQALEAINRSTGKFAFVFNCTGPLHAIGATGDPLLRQLLDGGQARPDALGIGLAVDDRSRVAGAERLWALGSLTKGAFWEIIAVPDIREQAAAVADDIARELG